MDLVARIIAAGGPEDALEILESLSRNRRLEQQFEALERFRAVMNLEHLAKVIQDTSLCGLGQSAPNPVLTTMRYYLHEYEAHVRDKKCPAGSCRALLTYAIDESLCKGCGSCAGGCPSGAAQVRHFEKDQIFAEYDGILNALKAVGI